MNDFEKSISIEDLHRLLTIDMETGKLFWKRRDTSWFKEGYDTIETQAKRWNTRFAEKEAFNNMGHDGYYRGFLFNNRIRTHRVVWAMANGSWPEHTIDHIDGDRSNNRPSNLRDVIHADNIQNQNKPLPNSKSKIRGVHQVPSGKWVAQLRAYNKRFHLGTFDTIEEAEIAYNAGRIKYQNLPVTEEHCSNGKEVF